MRASFMRTSLVQQDFVCSRSISIVKTELESLFPVETESSINYADICLFDCLEPVCTQTLISRYMFI